MRRVGAALAALVVLAGCDTPLTARDAAHEISAALGTPVTPLESGVYRFALEEAPRDDSIAVAIRSELRETGRPMFSDLLILQLHGASQSYVTSYGNLRLYPFEGEMLVLEIFAGDTESIFFLAQVDATARQLIVFEYNCTAYSEAARQDIGLLDQCVISDIGTLRAGLAALNTGALTGLRFEWTQALPDRE